MSLSVLRDRAGLALQQEPVVAALRAGEAVPIRSSIKAGRSVRLAQAQLAPFELELKFQNTTASRFGLRLYTDDSHWTEIGFNQAEAVFYIDRTRSGKEVSKDFPARTTAPLVAQRPNDLHLVVDRSSVEAYVQGGTIAMTDLIYPASSGIRVEAFSTGEPESIEGRLWVLQSVWK